MERLVALLCGTLFGAGLAVADMTNPEKVLNFLDFAGRWDPSLAFVMGAALVVTAAGYAIARRAPRPWLAGIYSLPTRSDVDRDLVLGAATFGVGWGLVGLCPGPALASLWRGSPEISVFVASMLVGVLLHRVKTVPRPSATSLTDPSTLGREALRIGTIAGLAMIPFAAVFRASGLRVNEYGRKTLELAFGELAAPFHFLLTFVQHLLISWVAALPLLWWIGRIADRPRRIGAGAVYGAGFYAVVNAFALPRLFGDPSPWALGVDTVYPSFVIHVVFGVVIGAFARTSSESRGDRRRVRKASRSRSAMRFW